MFDIEQMHEQAKELESLLRLQSMPIALKMLTSEEEIPEDALRPVRDMNYHLSFCQALAITRRRGLTIAETKKDMWCFEPVVGLGFVKPPQQFLEGHNRYPGSARTLEAGATWAQNMPRFDFPGYRTVVTAPLNAASFQPDIMLLYGSPAVMTQIMLAKNWLDGKDIITTMSGHAACVYYVVPALKEAQWRMSIPCGGDLRRTGCDDYSMIFSAPVDVLSALLVGLKTIWNASWGLPSNPTFAIEYPLEKSYVEIGKLIGMDWVK
jgi:uncharacterized protein (DUF169 family)